MLRHIQIACVWPSWSIDFHTNVCAQDKNAIWCFPVGVTAQEPYSSHNLLILLLYMLTSYFKPVCCEFIYRLQTPWGRVYTWKKTFSEVQVEQHYLGKLWDFLELGNCVFPAMGIVWSCWRIWKKFHWFKWVRIKVFGEKEKFLLLFVVFCLCLYFN